MVRRIRRNSGQVLDFPAIRWVKDMTPLPGSILSLTSNIFWNPHTSGTVVPWSKMAEIGNKASPTEDICAPASCDYNTGFGLGYHATEPGWTAYTGQAKGYVAKFSSPPGVHDVDVDPQFVDYNGPFRCSTRSTWGTRLQHGPSWASYSVGDIVSLRGSRNLLWLAGGVPLPEYRRVCECQSATRKRDQLAGLLGVGHAQMDAR